MSKKADKVLPKIAVIGLGSQGSKHWRAALELKKEGKVSKVVSCDPAVELANYHYFEQLFSQEKLDIVVVAAPNNLHLAMVKAALAQGALVLKEKPLVHLWSEVKELQDLVQDSTGGVMVCQQRFYKQAWLSFRELVGLMGKPQRFWYWFSVSDENQSWYWDIATAGGGVWLNMGWHPLSVLQWLWGGVASVELASNSGGARPWQYQTDHSAFARVQMKNGVQGSVFVSCVHNPKEVFRVETERGLIVIENEQITLHHEGGHESIDTEQDRDPYYLQLQEACYRWEQMKESGEGRVWLEEQLVHTVELQQHIHSASKKESDVSLSN